MTTGLPRLLNLDPVPTLLDRVRRELGADFAAGQPIRIARAPGRLDIMGGIADYTGSMVCEMPLDRAAAVAIQPRADRQVQVFSFNLFDDHKPFTLRIPLDALASAPTPTLRKEISEAGRAWAGYLAGCLHVLHRRGRIDLLAPAIKGVNFALYSTVPAGAGVSSSAAIEVAAMLGLVDHYGISRGDLEPALTPMALASMCQQVENEVVGAPCGVMDQVVSTLGESGRLLRMTCQPHTLLAPLSVPEGMRFIGIDSGVRHSVAGPQYGRTRCAAFMGHKIILTQMRKMGATAARELVADPLNGYLANLDPDDYKRLFRPRLPETIRGGEFLLKYGPTIDPIVKIEPDHVYPIVHATDHHVLEARRVKNFSAFIEHAEAMGAAGIGSRERGLLLDKAGHLMYASHQSYTMDAMLGSEACDLLVSLLRGRERQGIYGAKITGGGSGGTVAVLCEIGEITSAAIADAMSAYQHQTGHSPTLFEGSSEGAWRLGTAVHI